jgi:disulfide bond formation protein DsbB
MKRPDADGGTAPDRQPPRPPVDRSWSLVFGAWLVASCATLGALFFGEVMRLPPCTLCWYQRICMFPLAVILPFGLFPFNRGVVRAALPLAAIGTAVAAFHVLLVAGVIPEQIKPCTQGVPCSEKVIEWFGFVTIPLLALLAFVAVLVALIVASRRSTP